MSLKIITVNNIRRFLIVGFLFVTFSVKSQGLLSNDKQEKQWVDSVYSAMNQQQRIGQLFMLRANSETDSTEILHLSRLIKQYNIGGLCFFKGGPLRQVALTNYYQKLAATPLFISMDAEWGLGMRLDSTISFPRQMTLAAVKDEKLITDYGLTIASQLKRLGVHISFSPVADINNNPANPVINIRSFGENKQDVARKSVLYMKALQKGGILSVAKHFPGHGDTDTDSHHTLPFIAHSRTTIDTLDLFPFKALVDSGVDGIMVAHLNIPALDPLPDRPSSLSPFIIDSLLRKTLGFSGLVFSDALDMKGVANYDSPGYVELKALQAGNDVLLLSESVDKAIGLISQAIDSGLYSQQDLEIHCKRILTQKFRCGLSAAPPVSSHHLMADLNSHYPDNFNIELYGKAVTLLRNENNILPLLNTDTLRIATLMIGYTGLKVFQHRTDYYAQADHFTLPRNPDANSVAKLRHDLKNYNLIIIGINNTIPSPARNFGISETTIALVDTLVRSTKCIVSLFTLPYAVKQFSNLDKCAALLIGYQDNADVYDAAVQIIFGASAASAQLPVRANEVFPAGFGLITDEANRLSYNPWCEKSIDEASIRKIDSIVLSGITKKAYPGCQILISHKGNVFYNKAFGTTDYVNNQPVSDQTIYDLASVTKVAATTLAVMKLYDQGKINLDEPLSKKLSWLANSNKSKITIREVMTHQAGLVAWIPFYKSTLLKGIPDTSVYSTTQSNAFPLKVANRMYIRNNYKKYILDSIANSPLSDKREYKYSDLGFILMQQYVEAVSGKSIDNFVYDEFYRPMGLHTLTFNPLTKFTPERIAPTENDTVFRKQLIRGDVHDQAAAMLGGVAGHAGLFGTANDMAVLFQMLLQEGCYGGRQFLKPETITTFTKRQYTANRRGLGFDKPQLTPSEPGPACKEAPASSFGHTGFTGTYVWADPDNELIIVFLSNRVNPDTEPNKLVQLGIRTEIQETLYQALNKNAKTGQQLLRKPVNTTNE